MNLSENEASEAPVVIREVTFHSNERKDGVCDSCGEEVPPQQLVRDRVSCVHNGVRMTQIAYLCVECSE